MTERTPWRALPGLSLWAVPVLVMALPWVLQPHTEAPLLWWAGRAFGFVAYVALWLGMLTGLLISSSGLPKRLNAKVLFELHQQWTLAGAIATVLHVLAITSHEESRIGFVAALVPYAAGRLTGPVALGALAFWALALLSVSSWLRSHLSYRLWRTVHAVAFGAFLLAVTHSVSAGTDSGYVLVRWFYAATSAVIITGVVLRAMTTFTKRRPVSSPRRAQGISGQSADHGQSARSPSSKQAGA